MGAEAGEIDRNQNRSTAMYTRDEIKRGVGFFADGRWTCVYRTESGYYVTAERSEIPGPGLDLIAGGYLDDNGNVHSAWV